MHHLQIPKTNVICAKPIGAYHELTIRAKTFPSVHVGTMLAALDSVQDAALMQHPVAIKTQQYLLQEIERYERTFLDSPKDLLIAPLRAQGLRLLHNVFLFVDQIFRGAATLQSHPLLVIKHEAQLFSALAAEEEMLKATCTLLLNSV